MRDNNYYEDIKFYLILYQLFKKKVGNRIFIDYHCVREIMRRRLHKFPKVWHYEFLKEMEKHELIKRIGSTNGKNIKFELIGGNIEIILNQFNPII